MSKNVKDGKVVCTVKTKTGYTGTISAEITANQWFDIERVIEGRLESEETKKDKENESKNSKI